MSKITQAEVDLWNAENPVGTPVTRYILINPLRLPVATVTRSSAWIGPSGRGLVMVEGQAGGVYLGSVVPHPSNTSADTARIDWMSQYFGIQDERTIFQIPNLPNPTGSFRDAIDAAMKEANL